MKAIVFAIPMILTLVTSATSFADGGPASIPDAIEGCDGSYTAIACDPFEDGYIVRVHCTSGSIRAASDMFPGTPAGKAQCDALAASAH